jgi:hypothetical protein
MMPNSIWMSKKPICLMAISFCHRANPTSRITMGIWQLEFSFSGLKFGFSDNF